MLAPAGRLCQMPRMQGYSFDEEEFFRAIAVSSVRALLIGRRALIALGLPVMTRDYDFWLPAEDAEKFNEALYPFDLVPNRTPEQARAVGRYVLENDERVDVLIARSVSTVDGTQVAFADVWERRRSIEAVPGVEVWVPCVEDLILTKRFGARAKDAEDIRLLEVLRSKGSS